MDLRARAQSLGVTTHVGYKWKTTAELRRLCVEKTKAPQALAEAESHGTLGAYFRQPELRWGTAAEDRQALQEAEGHGTLDAYFRWPQVAQAPEGKRARR